MNFFQPIGKVFLPPYKTADLYKIFVVLFLVITLSLTVLETTANQTFVSVAAQQSLAQNSLVTLGGLTSNETVSGNISINLTATSQNLAVKNLELLINSRTLGLVNNPANTKAFTTTLNWNTVTERNGSYTLTARSLDSSGAISNSDPVVVTVSNIDTTPPTISFVQPTDGVYINNSSDYLVKLDAQDNSALSQVLLIIDNSLAANLSSPPYEYHWDISRTSTGSHHLTAIAFDLAGNKATAKISIYKGIKGISADF